MSLSLHCLCWLVVVLVKCCHRVKWHFWMGKVSSKPLSVKRYVCVCIWFDSLLHTLFEQCCKSACISYKPNWLQFKTLSNVAIQTTTQTHTHTCTKLKENQNFHQFHVFFRHGTVLYVQWKHEKIHKLFTVIHPYEIVSMAMYIVQACILMLAEYKFNDKSLWH